MSADPSGADGRGGRRSAPAAGALARIVSAWRELGPLAEGSWGHVAVLAAASALTGVLEAALLAIIVQVALALSAGARIAGISLGAVEIRAGVGALLALAAGLAGARLSLQVLLAWIPARIAADTQATLQRRLFGAYIRAEWPAQAAEREGHLQDLMTVHAGRAAVAVLTAAGGVTAVVTLAALLAGAFAVGPGPAALVIGVAAGLFWLLRPLGKLQRRVSTRLSASGLELARAVAEAWRVTEEHRVFGTGEAQARALASSVAAYREPYFRTQVAARLAPAAYQSVALVLLVAGLGALSVLPQPELATLGTVVLILVRSISYGQQIHASYTALNEALPFVRRIDEAVARFERRAVAAGTRPIARIDEVVLQDVGFAYHPGRAVLRAVNARLTAGQVVGVVGPSGAGKSTLAQLVLRLRRPTEGRVLVNGAPADEVCWEDWSRLVAYVPEDPKLIRGSVAENIRFFREIPPEEIEAAARAAHIHEEIVSELGGYGALIEQRGDTVSGGQRQRICLARALAGRPQLLVLDEPASALDARSEELVLETLRELRGKMTILLVAHRPALLDACDEVWELVPGDGLRPRVQGRDRDRARAGAGPEGGSDLGLPGAFRAGAADCAWRVLACAGA